MPEMSRMRKRVRKGEVGYAIFDLDGTLVDNLDLIVKSFNYATGEFVGREFSRTEVYSRFGPTLEQMVADTVPKQNASGAVKRYHEYYKRFFRRYARVYPGIPTLVSGLQSAGVVVSVCTASDARMTKTTLDESGIRDMFSVLVTADDVSRLKPDPEGLLKATVLMGGRTDLAVYLGDSVRDIEASRRAEIHSAAVLWGFGDGDELRAQGPDFVFRDPAEALTQLTH